MPSSGPVGRRSTSLLVIATAIALVVALASSLWQITRKPLWIDEAFSLGATNQLVDTIRGSGGSMAAYYVLLNGWTAVVGSTRMDLRSLSLLLCLVAVVLVSVLARQLLRPVEAAAAVLATAALPGLVRMAQDARAYSLLLVLATVGWLIMAQLVAAESADPGGRAGWWWGLGLVPVAVIGELSHGLFALQLVAMGLSVLVHPRRGALVIRLLPAAVALAGTFVLLWSMGARDVGDWILPLAWSQVRPFVGTFVGFDGWAMIGLGAVIVGGAVALIRRRRDGSPFERWAALVPIWWGLVPAVLVLALSVARPVFLGRYVLPSLPGLGMLIAVGAVRAWSWSVRRLAPGAPAARGARAARLVTALMMTAALVLALTVGRLSRTEAVVEEWNRAAELIAAEAQPGDGLVFTFPEHADQTVKDSARAPFEAAWREVTPRAVPVSLSPARPLGPVRRFDDLLPYDVLSPLLLAHPRVWIVQTTAFEPSLRRLLATPPAEGAFRRTRTDTFDGFVQVILLQRR